MNSKNNFKYFYGIFNKAFLIVKMNDWNEIGHKLTAELDLDWIRFEWEMISRLKWMI